MKTFLVVKPCFSNGNVGDAALIKTIENLVSLNKSNEIFIPQSNDELSTANISKFTSLIYFGNDCVPYYPNAIPIEKIKEFLNANKKVHIINTSWGTNAKGIDLIKSVANDPNFQIYMRDIYSHELIQEEIQFYNKPILTADLAFLCEKNSSKKVDKLEEWMNKSDKQIIGINTHNDFKEYNSQVKEELQKFICANKDKYRYLFIPHDSRKKEYEDLQTLHKSCNNIDGYTTNYLDPEYEKYITSKLYIVITGRMHLTILTIPNNIPAITISYNGIKAKGSHKHFGIEDLVLEPKNITLINDKVKYIENNYKTLQDKIEENKQGVEGLVTKNLNAILS